ncbi:MAG: glycosyltransferase family 4 protein [Anaerolineaceae bacterium]|nr:glycosyltransferase family 4 protein [Anaerolineaceae bacterium]
MKPKILMVGPGQGKPGGILALTDALVPVLAQEVDLRYFPTVQRYANSEMGQLSRRNVRLALNQYGRFLRELSQFRPDLVHIHTSQGLGWLKDTFYVALSKLYGRRLILHVHAAEYDALVGRKSRLLQAYTRFMLNRAEAVIAVSTGWKKALSRLVPEERIYAFRPCLDVEAYSPTVARTDNPVNAVFLGTIGARKGAFDLIEAMQLIPRRTPLRLWLAGGGEKEGDLEKARHKIMLLGLEDRCELIGTVQGQAKTELLQKAHIFVLPSYNEGLPFAIIEAMAAGLAIVATPVGGIPEVVHDGQNGLLVGPGDVQALAASLVQLTADSHLRQQMGQQNRRTACQDLDVRPYARRLVALYDAVLSDGKSSGTTTHSFNAELQPVYLDEE